MHTPIYADRYQGTGTAYTPTSTKTKSGFCFFDLKEYADSAVDVCKWADDGSWSRFRFWEYNGVDWFEAAVLSRMPVPDVQSSTMSTASPIGNWTREWLKFRHRDVLDELIVDMKWMSEFDQHLRLPTAADVHPSEWLISPEHATGERQALSHWLSPDTSALVQQYVGQCFARDLLLLAMRPAFVTDAISRVFVLYEREYDEIGVVGQLGPDAHSAFVHAHASYDRDHQREWVIDLARDYRVFFEHLPKWLTAAMKQWDTVERTGVLL